MEVWSVGETLLPICFYFLVNFEKATAATADDAITKYGLFISDDVANYYGKALSACQERNMTLVSIEDEDKNDAIFEYLQKTGDTKNNYIIGAKRGAVNGPYRWPNGHLLSYRSFGKEPEPHLFSQFEPGICMTLKNNGKKAVWFDAKYNTKARYICEKPEANPGPGPPPPPNPYGFTFTEYKTKNYEQVMKTCRGKEKTVDLNGEKREILYNVVLANDDDFAYYVAQKNSETGIWEYWDGTPVENIPDKIDNSSTVYTCLEIRLNRKLKRLKWSTASCTQFKFNLCEKNETQATTEQSTVSSTTTAESDDAVGAYGLYISEEVANSYRIALSACQQRNLTLVSIEDQGKNDAIFQYLQKKGDTKNNYIIGANRRALNGPYRWPNGHLLSYRSFGKEPEPHLFSQFEPGVCMMLKNNGKKAVWSDAKYTTKARYICEKPEANPGPGPPPPPNPYGFTFTEFKTKGYPNVMKNCRGKEKAVDLNGDEKRESLFNILLADDDDFAYYVAQKNNITGVWEYWDETTVENIPDSIDNSSTVYTCLEIRMNRQLKRLKWSTASCTQFKFTVCEKNDEKVTTNMSPITMSSTTTSSSSISTTTLSPTTMSSTTMSSTTMSSPSIYTTTLSPTTQSPTSMSSTTMSSTSIYTTTLSPTTQSPTSMSSTNMSSTAVSPTSISTTTLSPTTMSTATMSSTTMSSPSISTITESSTTMSPTNMSSTTVSPNSVTNDTANEYGFYFTNNLAKSFYDATGQCERLGLSIISITSAEKNQALSQQLTARGDSSEYWLPYIASGGTIYSPNFQKLKYTNLAKDENCTGNCVVIYLDPSSKEAVWCYANCVIPNYVLCEGFTGSLKINGTVGGSVSGDVQVNAHGQIGVSGVASGKGNVGIPSVESPGTAQPSTPKPIRSNSLRGSITANGKKGCKVTGKGTVSGTGSISSSGNADGKINGGKSPSTTKPSIPKGSITGTANGKAGGNVYGEGKAGVYTGVTAGTQSGVGGSAGGLVQPR